MDRAKKLTEPVDPNKLFHHAYRIWTADLDLRKSGKDFEAASAHATGSMVLNVFACELFLKCLLILEQGGAPAATHRLDVLFRQVSHKRKRRIEELWNTHCRQKVLFMRDLGCPTDLPNAIVRCGDAFNRLRYHYEDPTNTVYYLGDLPWILGRVVLEIKPEWNQPTLSTSPPQ